MKFGHTRRLDHADVDSALFLARNRASLVVLEGHASGSEYVLERASYVIGRSSGSDLVFEDDAMSGSHAAIELTEAGFKIRDMGSTNGTFVNGSAVQAAALKHGDKIKVGEHIFQYIQEKLERSGSYDLSGEM